MKQKTILIRCITDEQKGFGHMSRCILIANSLRKKGFNIIFIINRNGIAIKEIRKNKFQYSVIPKSISYQKEHLFIKKIMNSKKYDAIIVDMREYGEKLLKQLSNNLFKTIQFDDVWCKISYANLLFNSTITKKYHNYKINNADSKLFLGSKYFLSNFEFHNNIKKMYDINHKRKYCIVISMGGSDFKQSTLKITKSIMNLKQVNVQIITGPFYRDLQKLEKLIKTKNHISIINSHSNIWEYFVKSDVVISNAGSTLFELAIQKIPTLCIPLVEHQTLYAKEFSRKGFSINLGLWKNLKTNNIQQTLNRILENVSERRNISSSGNKLVDGKGLLRTTNIITRLLN